MSSLANTQADSAVLLLLFVTVQNVAYLDIYILIYSMAPKILI